MTPNQTTSVTAEILRLKQEKNFLVLAHLYEDLSVQKIADFCGDSFELAKRAKASDKPNILFCGVRFMGESAKILNPDKHVFLPCPDAGCAMADMVNAAAIRALLPAPYALEVKDNTLPLYGAEVLKKEGTLLGAFYRKLEPVLVSENPEERETAILALKYGLKALNGREL